MINLDNFDWGWMNEDSDLARFHKSSMTEEIFNKKQYEEIYQVKEGDIVVDIGASVGPFTYSIIDKNPKQVYCIEPDRGSFVTMFKNLSPYKNVTNINKGINYKDELIEMSINNETNYKEKLPFTVSSGMYGIKFNTLLKHYSINHIDFLKTDCEGGEYYIFNDENMGFLLNNVNKIVGEWHLSSPNLKIEFKYFRDKYLKHFKNVKVRDVHGVDITWDLWNDHFIEYYNQVILHISNE